MRGALADYSYTGYVMKRVFAEPQFKSKLVDTVVEGTSARTGVIDPLGAKLGAGPDLYFQLIQAMSKSFEDCLHLR